MSTASFVEQLFSQFLGRSADLAGRDYWVEQIDVNGVPASSVAQTFINSSEYAGVILPIARLYYAAFGRIPDAAGLSYWVTTFRAGATVEQISTDFVRSAEFATLYGANVTNTNFIDLLYKNVLGRTPDAGGKAYWLARLTTDKQPRAAVLTAFANSPELIANKNSEIKVVVQYQTILGTTPTRAQIDAGLRTDPVLLTTQLFASESYTGVPAPHLNVRGNVVDGYLGSANVFIDQNRNHLQDPNELATTADLQGKFSFAGRESFNGVLIAQNGRDITTGQVFEGQLTAPSGSSVITPLTTLLQTLIERNEAPRAELTTQLIAHMLLPAGVDITRIDPIAAAVKSGATTAEQNLAILIHIRNAQINSLVTATAAFLHEVGIGIEPGKVERATFMAIADALLNPDLPPPLDLADAATLQAIMANAGRLLLASSEQQNQVDALAAEVASVVAAINTALGLVAESTPLASLTKIGQIQMVAVDINELIAIGVSANDLTQAVNLIAPAAFDAAVDNALPRLGPIVQDSINPTLLSSTPADNASGILASSNITLKFSEAVSSGSGNLMITDGVDTRTIALNDASQVSFSGDTVTINPALDLKNGSSYRVLIDKGAIQDLLGNPYAGISDVTTLNFTVPANTVQLSTLNGTTGSRYDALVASGMAVASAGDVNGDGFDDFLIGASAATNTGASYLVFGKSTPLTATTKLSALSGRDGVRLDGVTAGEFAGSAIASAGDVNGDGLADVIVGANGAAPGGSGLAGSAYILFGKTAAFTATLKLSTLDGKTGFRLDGGSANSWLGSSVGSAGDVNGDGIDDLIVGANGVNGTTGAAYVVLGKSGATTSTLNVSKLDGSNGFALSGVATSDNTGLAVSSAGDLNRDGFDDMLVGAFGANRGAGAAYVVFGKASGFAANLALGTLDGTNGVRLDGMAGDNAGRSVAKIGDFNGDGIDDIVIGAFHANNDTGSAYVVFGKTTAFDATLDLGALDGKTGFRLDGVSVQDLTGISVATAGDVNGDGLADLLVGARGANPRAGASYLVYGTREELPAKINLADLNGVTGFKLIGGTDSLSAGSVAGVGDVNGDGYGDLLIGAQGATNVAGSSYLVLGNNARNTITTQGTIAADTLTGTAGVDAINGMGGADKIDGAGGADLIHGGAGDDRITIPSTDFAFIHGGGGKDTLALAGEGVHLNLTTLTGKLQSIEVIDIGGTGNNEITISAQNLIDLSTSGSISVAGNTGNTIYVTGNAGDIVHLSGGTWVDGNIVNGSHKYSQGNAVILIGTTITVELP